MFRDLFRLTREAKDLQRSLPTPDVGEAIGQMRETVATINAQQGDAARLLSEGLPATAIVRELEHRAGPGARQDQARLIDSRSA